MLGFLVGTFFGVFLAYAQYRVGNKLFYYFDKLTGKKEATQP